MIYLLILTLLVLFFAWYSYFRNEQPEKKPEPLIYLQGNNTEGDSDSDMQEQYDYLNKKKDSD